MKIALDYAAWLHGLSGHDHGCLRCNEVTRQCIRCHLSQFCRGGARSLYTWLQVVQPEDRRTMPVNADLLTLVLRHAFEIRDNALHTASLQSGCSGHSTRHAKALSGQSFELRPSRGFVDLPRRSFCMSAILAILVLRWRTFIDRSEGHQAWNQRQSCHAPWCNHLHISARSRTDILSTSCLSRLTARCQSSRRCCGCDTRPQGVALGWDWVGDFRMGFHHPALTLHPAGHSAGDSKIVFSDSLEVQWL